MKSILILLSATLLLASGASFADEAKSTTEQAKEAGQGAVRDVKKGARAASDKACEMVDGKMQCAGQKLKHKVQNVGDSVKDKVDDAK